MDTQVSYRDPYDVALTLVTGLYREGGATTSLRAGQARKTDGYVVAVPNHGFQISTSELQPYHVTFWLERERETATLPNVQVGAWEDPQEGTATFDLAFHYATLNDAYDAAVQGGQKAFYDVAAGRDVYVQEVGLIQEEAA